MKLFGYSFNVVELLIAANVIVSFLGFIDRRIIVSYGLTPAYFFEEPWTLITSMFLHGDILHLMMNMLSLYFIGPFLLSVMGEKDFLKVYFVGGIAGGLLYVLLGMTLGVAVAGTFLDNWIAGPFHIAIGASGALFAVAGAIAIIRPDMQVIIPPIFIPLPIGFAVFGLFVVFSLIVPGIAWQAHFGGLAVGALYGMSYRKKRPLKGHMYGAYGRNY